MSNILHDFKHTRLLLISLWMLFSHFKNFMKNVLLFFLLMEIKNISSFSLSPVSKICDLWAYKSKSHSACRFVFSDFPRMFHQTFHRKEEERPFSINALYWLERPLPSSRTVAKQWAGKSHVDEVDSSVRYFSSRKQKYCFYFEDNEATLWKKRLTAVMSSPPKEKTETKAGHLPAGNPCYC